MGLVFSAICANKPEAGPVKKQNSCSTQLSLGLPLLLCVPWSSSCGFFIALTPAPAHPGQVWVPVLSRCEVVLGHPQALCL